jgi:hypothetical protein
LVAVFKMHWIIWTQEHTTCPYPEPYQSSPCPDPTSCRPILILSSHLHLGVPSGQLPSGLPTMILYAPLSSFIRAACLAHLILLDLITHTFVNNKARVRLQVIFFSSSSLSSVYYMSRRFVILTAAFQRTQVSCVDAVSLCVWFPTFRTWLLRSFETSGTTHQTTQGIIPENLNPHSTASLHVNVS